MKKIPIVKTGQVALLTCSVIFAVLPTILVVLRLIARRIANRRLDSADYLIVAAWVCSGHLVMANLPWWLCSFADHILTLTSQFMTVALAIVCILGKHSRRKEMCVCRKQ